MKLITIQEFQHTAALPDSAMLWLLKSGGIAHSIDSKQGIMIDLDSASVQKTIKGLTECRQSALTDNRSLIIEKIGAIISDNVELIFSEALASCGRQKE